ncbi:hypothetical protein [Streptomyces sp. 769]|uniref:hypothetical protein n=1 Tax=Streptomyces sp. 769 TaxID=1262452 RepID=UPI0005822277|nr:hypothetical protein [Streptomyces sp. 769]AJC58561.1 hypothetical protein GZL_05988 [Streptomyces sp. 769]
MTYEVTVGGPITMSTGDESDARMEQFFDNAVEADGTYFEAGEPPLPPVTTLIKCPECGADRDLTARGTWESPAEITCSAGHCWTPDLGVLPTGRTLMQELLVRVGIDDPDRAA